MDQSADRAISGRRWAPAAGLVLLVAVLSLLTGRVADQRHTQRTILLDESPTAVAVDRRTGRAFIATSGPDGAGHVLVLDTRSGTLLRTAVMTATPVALAVDERAGHVVVATSAVWVAMLDAARGTLLGTTTVPGSPYAVAVDERTGRAFIATTDLADPSQGRVSVLDTRSGRLLRTVALRRLPGLLALDRPAGRVLLTGPAAGATATLSVLDAGSGTLLHVRRLGWQPTALAVDERRGRAYVIGADHTRMNVLDTRTGALLRTLWVGLQPLAVAVDRPTGQVLLLRATDARVHMLDARTGRLVGTRGAGQGAETHLLVADGARVVLASRRQGTLSLLDLHRGVRCAVPVGGDLIALVTDERAGRTVVLTGADMVNGGDVEWAAWARELLAWPPRVPRVPRRRRFVAGAVSLLDTSCA